MLDVALTLRMPDSRPFSLPRMMPKLGGRGVYERIRRRQPHTPAIFASGYSLNTIHTGFVLDEGLTLIQKPYRRDDLLRKIREVLS